MTANDSIMELRVMDLLREKGLRIGDLADRMGTDQSNLKKSLSHNPKLSTLQDVAKALGVDIHELFTGDRPSHPVGLAVIDGRTYGLTEMANVVQLPSYTDYASLRKAVKAFVQGSIKEEKSSSFGAFVNSYELFSLVYDEKVSRFVLSLYYGNKESKTYFYDRLEYADWKNGNDEDPEWSEDVISAIISDIEGSTPYQIQTEE